MRVFEIAERNPVTVGPDDTVQRAADLMHDLNIRHLPVVEEGVVLGMLSDRDVKAATGDPGPEERRAGLAIGAVAAAHRPVREIMAVPVLGIEPDADVGEAAAAMVGAAVGALAVVRDRRLEGIITETDVLRAYVEAAEEPEIVGGMVTTLLAAGNVIDHMPTELSTIAPDAPVAEALDIMAARGIRHLPVVDEDERFVGILSDRDIRRAIGKVSVGEPLRGRAGTVAAFMTLAVHVIGTNATLEDAARLMVRHKIGALPVLEHGRLAGIITATDILAAFVQLLC